ncbi:T9SS type A sorting domain-containing protein [Polaribacter aquimarinus]|uniref:Secretion system C-terminal sorting domain-containing protein n=1 Tax=Polaribacter aquimarinus TaxID=2100726 RepID=A0A2U2JBL0_9FLAO|nr:T9SS type A sorting domain-containing protein [Polaribacter aquimarinus]PWG05661.1 hypothetical protein DIS07_04245 [Polaribacter aquimarinus]
MKNIYLFIIFSFIIPIKLIACQWIPDSFCATSQSSSYLNDLIVYGKISHIDNDGINFEIIDVLRGQEKRTSIRIWDGVDFDCNGIFSMAASELGNINDHLIIILPKITEKKSNWEVIGDYRRPDFFLFTPHLNVENGVVYGVIFGQLDKSYVEDQANYLNFKNSWNANNNCSSVILRNKNHEFEELKVLTLSKNKFKIVSNRSEKKQLKIYNIFGLKLESEFQVNNEIEIDLSSYSSGIYFIYLIYENNKIKTIKLVKK